MQINQTFIRVDTYSVSKPISWRPVGRPPTRNGIPNYRTGVVRVAEPIYHLLPILFELRWLYQQERMSLLVLNIAHHLEQFAAKATPSFPFSLSNPLYSACRYPASEQSFSALVLLQIAHMVSAGLGSMRPKDKVQHGMMSSTCNQRGHLRVELTGLVVNLGRSCALVFEARITCS